MTTHPTADAAASGLRNRAPSPTAGPRSPSQLRPRSLWTAVRRSVVEFDRDNAWDWAAALTYYGVLSIFPGIVVLVSLVGLVRKDDLQPLITSLSQVAPGPVRSILENAVSGLQDSPRQAGIFAVVGLVIALWSASGYAGAFIRAANAAYDVPEGRPVWKTIPIRIGITVTTGVLLVLSAAIVVVTGNLSAAVGRTLGLESTTVAIWNIAKWPVLVVLVTVMFAVLYRASPNARQGGFRWVSPGGVLAVVLWMAASAGFGLYAANFASYDKTYGTLAGVVVFLTWLWITNLALLLGLEVDAELERQRAIAAGLPANVEPYLRLRDDRAITSATAGLADKATEQPLAQEPPARDDGPVREHARVGEPSPAAEPPRSTGRSSRRLAAGSLGFAAGVAAGLMLAGSKRRR